MNDIYVIGKPYFVLEKNSLPRGYKITLLYLCGFANDISKWICNHIMYNGSLQIGMLLLEMIIQIRIANMFKFAIWTRVQFQLKCSCSKCLIEFLKA